MVLYIDGGCTGNGQRDQSLRTMCALVTDASGRVLDEQHERGGSNNIAELWAFYLALWYCATNGITDVAIFTDSRNNLSWGAGRRPGKKINDRGVVLRMQEHIAKLRKSVKAELTWISRHQNLAGHEIERRYGI